MRIAPLQQRLQTLRQPLPVLLRRSVINVFLRSVLAAFGGYLVSALWTAVLSRLLPIDAASAVLSATMLGFIIFTIWVICAFAMTYLKQLFLLFLVASLSATVVLYSGVSVHG